MRLPLILIPAVFAVLSACDEFPELDGTVDSRARSAAYPDLVPLETITSEAPDPQIQPETLPDLETRVDRLKARATRLKGDVIDAETHQRMKAGVE